jgi:hypothetical protein
MFLKAGCIAVGGLCVAALAGDPWADQVISYVEGGGVSPGYNMPGSALGEPTRFTGVGAFPGAVTPFNPAYLSSEVVSIGFGGSLTLRFEQPINNDPLNPYGIDLLVFGNAGYIDASFPNGVAGSLFGAGFGGVQVSQDGQTWFAAPVTVDQAFPTLGYSDLTDPYALTPGSVLSDFTRPVDPAFVPTGLAFSQILAGYDGSGGGTGIDLELVGLLSISFVRITNNLGATATVEIDAVAAVTPVPSPALAVLGVGLAGLAARRRR